MSTTDETPNMQSSQSAITNTADSALQPLIPPNPNLPPEPPPMPPRVVVSITSATAQPTTVGPNTTAHIAVSGTVGVFQNDATTVTVPHMSVNVNGGTSTPVAVASNGSWSTTVGGGAGSNIVTATGSVNYQMPGSNITHLATGASSTSVTIALDNTPPQFAVNPPPTQVNCPTPGTPYSFTSTGTASDTQTGIASISATVDNLAPGTITNPPQNWSMTVNVPAVVGAHTIAYKCTDGAGNTTSQGPFTITLVDQVPPQISQVSFPSPPVIDNQPVTLHVSGSVVDVSSGVQWVKVSLINALLQTVVIPDTPATITGAHGPNQAATWAIDLPNIATAGSYKISITAADISNNITQPLTVPVTIQSIPAPIVTFTIPDPVNDRGKVYPDNGSGVTLHVEGTARADLSTLTNVTISLDNGTATPVQQKVSGNWGNWFADIAIPHSTANSHTLTVQATNSAHNPQFQMGSASLTVLVAQTSYPLDTNDNISPLAYLRALLNFATQRVLVSSTQNLAVSDLKQQFYQPFDAFNVDEDVQTIRVCAEVLRAYLAANGKVVAPSTETQYRQIAYEALLNVFGTSYVEIRLARSATSDVRQALATRLGILLQPSRPDQLDTLLLQAGQFTEATLEALFGYLDTHRQLTQPLPSPSLLAWQQTYLRSLWSQQDQARTTPIIDPDLISQADLLNVTPNNAAYALWSARSTWVQTQLSTLASNTVPNETTQARFDRLVNATLAPTTVTNLLALDASQQQGNIIDASLAQIPLPRAAFTYLLRMRALAVTTTLLDTEWQDIYSILVQVMKARLASSWIAAEQTITLGPDYFLLSDPTTLPILPTWRATAVDRQNWRNTLQSRIDQQSSLNDAYAQAITQAEIIALPVLLTALITAATPTGTTVDMVNWLTERLLIDVSISSSQTSSRVTQAIETVQGILTSLRDGRFQDMNTQIGPDPAASWTLAEAGTIFDQEWTWMGTYANWRAAMLVFIYPENLLRPGLRDPGDMTQAFSDMLATLRNTPTITPQFVRDTAAQYLTELRSTTGGAPTYPSVPPEILNSTFVITEQLAAADLLARATLTQTLFQRINKTQPGLRYITEVFFSVPLQIALTLEQAGQYSSALDWYRTVYAYNLPLNQRRIWYGLIDEQSIQTVYQTTNLWLIESLNPHQVALQRAGAYTRFTIISIVRCFLDYADAEFASDTSEAIARARALYINALDLLNSTDMHADTGGYSPNPIPQALLLHASLNLFKIRTGRNIAGMYRQLEIQPTTNALSSTALVVAAQSGAGTVPLQPTPYRYVTLIDRAKQLVNLAQQMETSYLQALEKADAETYTALQAHQNLEVTLATVQLQNLRVTEASDGVKLATLQQQRAQIQQETYQSWIDAGPSQLERNVLQDYADMNAAQNSLAGMDALITATQAITSAASASLEQIPIAALGAGLTTLLAEGRAGLQINLNNIQASMQSDTLQASWERRQQEWQLQQAVAQQDVVIGQQQVLQATDHVNVATQEYAISQMQSNHAQATVDFLSNKFTNADLYEWMSGILGQVYSYFLQQATAMARLAQNQLAFERQEKPPSFIQSDYWQTPTSTTTSNTDRRGLTGSARLLQDIYQLDQYAFETNKRKLQLTRAFSLAQLAPFEFAQFRQTGVLTFATPMAWFDQDFPGHYLRLIKRVRVSVIALIPPYQGIKATLSCSGISHVVIGSDTFQTALVRHDPESVALTSPIDATGTFDLDPQSDLLLPFEGLGVDTTWEFQMPRAANAFDYSTIADIVLKIDYTALASADYRQQVIQLLNQTVSADRSYSLRQQFPDAWYDLNNPDATATNLTASFSTTRDDFPTNIDQLKIQQLALYISRADGATFEVSGVGLQFTPTGSQTPSGGSATTIDGIISTRRGNAAGWLPITASGSTPIGTWQLTMPQASVAPHLANADILDILLVITYTGQVPAWPI